MARRYVRSGSGSVGQKRDVAPGRHAWAFSRRDFLKLSGAGTAALWMQACDIPLPFPLPDIRTTVTRPEDLVHLVFEFSNLQVGTNMAGELELTARSPLGYIIVHFQPQHFHERAFDEGLPLNPVKPVNVLISGPSRVVLKVPVDAPPIIYSSDGLLAALGRLQMNVVPNAVPPSRPSPIIVLPPPVITGPGLGLGRVTRGAAAAGSRAQAVKLAARNAAQQRGALAAQRRLAAANGGIDPGITIGPIATAEDPDVRPRAPLAGETALELPFRLILSPHASGGWAHNTTAEQSQKHGRHELWHTRLGVRSSDGQVSEKPSYLRAVRAVWTRDPQFDPAMPAKLVPTNHFLGSLSAQDRSEIVHQSSNFVDLGSYQPRAVDVDNLMLSTLGGWLDSRANFGLGSPLNLVAWQHQAAMGRDYFVQTVRKGRLFPWGHYALKIKITERKFRDPDRSVAYLYQRTFIKIIEPARDYPVDWRKSPLRQVVVKTLVTPPLSDLPANEATATPIKVMGTAFRFKMQGLDRGNNLVDFLATATWAPITGTQVNAGDRTAAQSVYNGYSDGDRTVKLDGQRVAFAENDKVDDATYETVDMMVDGSLPADAPMGVSFPSPAGIGYLPSVRQANMNIEAIRHLVGQGGATPFEYHLTYLQNGFSGANKGELLFQLKSGTPALGLNFKKKSDASGGFVAPSLNIIGLGRKTGPISGDPGNLAGSFADIANNDFDPLKFLKSVDAQLFGIIPLYEIIKPVTDALGGLDSAPSFVTQTVDAVTGFLDDISRLADILEKLASQYGMQVQTSVQALLDKIEAVGDAINALFGSASLEQAVANAKDLIDDPDTDDDLVGLLGTFVSVTVDQLPAGVISAEREALKKRVNAIIDVLQAVKDGLTAFATGLEMAKNLTVKLAWKAPLQADEPYHFFEPLPGGGFILEVEVRGKKVGDKPAGFDVVAGIEKFDVNVFGKDAKLVSIPFERLVFKVESGKKPDVDVVFRGGIGFDGILAFIETLSKLIPGAGFSDPPAIEVDAEGIRSSFSIPIPSIAVGVFSLQNISIGAGFNVPFIGPPLSIGFNFCTREEMFVLTVMMVGGGGFVNLKLSPRGMMLLEAAFEARAQLAIDLGVASGSISIAVGVYFRLEQNAMGKQTGELTGYIRFQGRVSVLGLITASITLLLEMTYEFETGKLKGRATLTIEITIVFFSISVELSVERKLAGSNNDPLFVDQMAPYMLDGELVDPWEDYMGSFLMAA
jgi:hypothetical protein